MSLARQRQLLFKDYSGVGEPKRRRGKYTNRVIGHKGH